MAWLWKNKEKFTSENKYNQDLQIEHLELRIQEKMKYIGLIGLDEQLDSEFQQLIQEHQQLLEEQLMAKVGNIVGKELNQQAWKQYIANFLTFLTIRINQDFANNQWRVVDLLLQTRLQPDWLIGATETIIDTIQEQLLKKSDWKQVAPKIRYFHKILMLNQMVWIELYTKNLVSSFSHGVSELVFYNAQIDQVKELLESLDQQVRFSSEVQHMIQDINATVEEVASTSNSAADFSNQSVLEAVKGQKMIKDALEEMAMLEGQYQKVVSAINDFSQKISQMERMIQLIRDIADQTNLLALNANIEAARAGEHGLGFSVVAQEVRKLSEHSKESVDLISQTIQELVSDAESIKNWVLETENTVNHGVKESSQAIQKLMQIIDTFNTISESVQGIAAANQEQAASIAQVTEQNNKIDELIHIGKDKGVVTGEAVYQLSVMSEKLRFNIDQIGVQVNEKELLNLAKTDHLLWRWKIYNMLLGYVHIDANSIQSEHHCRLGKWYYSEQANAFRHLPTFKKMEGPHRMVHQTAKEAAQAYANGNIHLAEQKLKELQDYSNEIIHLLDEISNTIKDEK